eukprot:g19540.t1
MAESPIKKQKTAAPDSISLMDAVVFEGKKQVACRRVARPQIIDPHDALIKVLVAGLCGSDLHPYHQREALGTGCIMGHEFVGEITATGTSVRKFSVGQIVSSPFSTSCGVCYFCQRGLTCRCKKGQVFGWKNAQQQGLDGAQAQFVRVPLADTTLVVLSESLASIRDRSELEIPLLAGDILSTAYFCASNAEVAGLAARDSKEQEPGAVLVVVGLGPVGLLTLMWARHFAGRKAVLVGVDTVPARLERAKEFGADYALDCNADSVVSDIRALAQNGSQGAAAVMECVGSQSALQLAYDVLVPGGVLSSVGVHTSPHLPFNGAAAYDKNITFRSGRCPARALMDTVLRLSSPTEKNVFSRELISSLITHRETSLTNAAEAYKRFDSKQDGCVKTLFYPWGLLPKQSDNTDN